MTRRSKLGKGNQKRDLDSVAFEIWDELEEEFLAAVRLRRRIWFPGAGGAGIVASKLV